MGEIIMNKEKYEQELAEKRRKHFENLNRKPVEIEFIPCSHDECDECHGTGINKLGRPCVHMISCRCPKCQPYSLSFVR